MPSKSVIAETVNNSDFFYIVVLGCILVVALFLIYKLYSKYTGLSEKIENIEYTYNNKLEENRISKNIPEEINKDIELKELPEERIEEIVEEIVEEDMARIDEENENENEED